ncbi:hypothetical protein GCM10027567_03710 [Spongiibacter taiwanensis]
MAVSASPRAGIDRLARIIGQASCQIWRRWSRCERVGGVGIGESVGLSKSASVKEKCTVAVPIISQAKPAAR